MLSEVKILAEMDKGEYDDGWRLARAVAKSCATWWVE